MAKPQEDPANKTLTLLPTPPQSTASESHPSQNPNPSPPTSTAEDPRCGGEEGKEKKDSSLKPVNATLAALEAAVASGAAADLEKKLRRAERFGVAVQLSEEEKRRTRAERFGTSTGSPLHNKTNGGNQEELKRKARAERFGLAVQTPTDEEAKKKARSERFGQKSNSSTSEEEKMKARAARFSQTPITSTKTNGNGKAGSEVKLAAVRTKEEPNS